MPSCGARMSMRLSWSSAATLRSTELGDLGLDLAQVLADLGAHVLVDLQDLQLDLGDLALGLRGRGDELAALAFEARRVALERGDALELHEVLACHSSRTPSSSWLIHSICCSLAAICPAWPWRSSLSWEMRSLSCAFWPSRALRRISNSLLSPPMTRATSRIGARGHEARPERRPCRAPSSSASCRARRAQSSSRPLTTIARLACVCVSSSRMTMSPALTLSPSRTRSSPTTPPVGCCTFLTLVSTTSWPCAITAPGISVVEAQPPMPPTSSTTTTRPARRWRRMDC